MNDTFGGILFCVLVIMTAVGVIQLIKEERVSPIMYNHAQLVCENNNGLRYYEYDNNTRGQAVCNNGAEFNIMRERIK